jgi:acetyl esterase
MPLDPSAQALLDFMNTAVAPPIETMSPSQARAMFDGAAAAVTYTGADVLSVEERTIEGVGCQIVIPHGDLPMPALIWFHGGGGVLGRASQFEAVARDLASYAGCMVVSVDYRLAPENPFPAAVEDAVAVTQWVLAEGNEIGIDPTRVAVGGDSAGGNLAAVVALQVAGLVHQLLVYPPTDATMSQPSFKSMGEGYYLTAAEMRWFSKLYLPDGDSRDPRVSPFFADNAMLTRTCPAHIITAGHDPLHDDGSAYADRLRLNGVPTIYEDYPGQMHAFFTMGYVLPEGAAALRKAAQVMADTFGQVRVG